MEALKKKIYYEISQDDYVLAILSQIKQSKIKKEPISFHRLFMRIQQQFDIPKKLRFNFAMTRVAPTSDELYEVVYRLETSQCLVYTSDMQYYLLDETREIQNKRFEKFDSRLRHKFKHIGIEYSKGNV